MRWWWVHVNWFTWTMYDMMYLGGCWKKPKSMRCPTPRKQKSTKLTTDSPASPYCILALLIAFSWLGRDFHFFLIFLFPPFFFLSPLCKLEMKAHGRSLSELLEQQQEPFVLDVYLVERGYSRRFLASRSCSLCWPGKACKRLKLLTSHGFKSWRNALSWFHRAPRLNNVPKHNACSSSSWNYNIVHCKFFKLFIFCVRLLMLQVLVADDAEEEKSGMSLSLPRKILRIFNDFLEVAYAPAFYQLVGSKRQIYKWSASERKVLHAKIPPLNSTRYLVISELSCSGDMEWSGFRSQVGEIGVELEATLFEDIKEETISDMICSQCKIQTWYSLLGLFSSSDSKLCILFCVFLRLSHEKALVCTGFR